MSGPDYILCLDTSPVPSESVTCFFCGCNLLRSLQSPKVRAVCMSCVPLLGAESAPQ